MSTPRPAGGSATAASVIAGPVRIAYTVRASDTTAAFLAAILDRRLVGSRCPSCTQVHVPPRGVCPLCAVRTAEFVPVGPHGTVTTFSIVRIPFEGQRIEPPYACAHVLLDGADAPLLHIVGGCPVDAVHVGMRVEPVWSAEPEPSLASIRYYRPLVEAAP